jgi:hypothetical protein
MELAVTLQLRIFEGTGQQHGTPPPLVWCHPNGYRCQAGIVTPWAVTSPRNPTLWIIRVVAPPPPRWCPVWWHSEHNTETTNLGKNTAVASPPLRWCPIWWPPREKPQKCSPGWCTVTPKTVYTAVSDATPFIDLCSKHRFKMFSNFWWS